MACSPIFEMLETTFWNKLKTDMLYLYTRSQILPDSLGSMLD